MGKKQKFYQDETKVLSGGNFCFVPRKLKFLDYKTLVLCIEKQTNEKG